MSLDGTRTAVGIGMDVEDANKHLLMSLGIPMVRKNNTREEVKFGIDTNGELVTNLKKSAVTVVLDSGNKIRDRNRTTQLVRVYGNPNTIVNGSNVFGSSNVHEMMVKLFTKINAKVKQPLIDMKAVEAGEYYVSKITLNVYMRNKSEKEVNEALRKTLMVYNALCICKNANLPKFSVIGNYEGHGFRVTTPYVSMLMYNKVEELASRGRESVIARIKSIGLEDEMNEALRLELELSASFLRNHRLQKGSDWLRKARELGSWEALNKRLVQDAANKYFRLRYLLTCPHWKNVTPPKNRRWLFNSWKRWKTSSIMDLLALYNEERDRPVNEETLKRHMKEFYDETGLDLNIGRTAHSYVYAARVGLLDPRTVEVLEDGSEEDWHELRSNFKNQLALHFAAGKNKVVRLALDKALSFANKPF